MTAAATAPEAPQRPDRGRGDLPRRWLLVGTAVFYLPLTFLGYGTDIHVDDVLRAGRLALDGDYEPSRAGGLPPFEVAAGVLDRVGGALLVNLAGLAFALLAVWCVHRLLDLEGSPWPGLGALALAANPWFGLAATSLGEVVWALGLALAGAVAARRDRRLLAGVLFGVAVGCRPAIAVVAVAWLLAERTGAASARAAWRDTLRTGLVALAVALACFAPAWLDAGGSLDFVDPALDPDGWGVQLGRFLVKNVAAATILGTVVLLVGVRQVAASVGRWRPSPVVRFAVATVVLAEALFLLFPDKPVHLLPVVAAIALLAGTAARADRRWLVALAAAQLISGIVGSTIAAPDDADGRESGRVSLRPADGILVNDIRCRLHDVDRGTWIRGDSIAERFESEARADANWHCQRDAWRDS